MNRFKMNFAVLAFVLGTAIAFTQSSFTTSKSAAAAKRTGTNYVFNGTDASQMKNAAYYSVEGSAPSCDEANVVPCEIDNVSGSLQTWLNARTQSQILAQSAHTRD